MRWRWIDRFIAFSPNDSAKAVKRVALGGPFMEDNFPPYAVMPKPLVIEGIAQTAGLLVGQSKGFTKAVIMAKIPKAYFAFEVREGDVLTYTAVLENVTEEGARVRATSHVGDRLHAEVEIVFAHVTVDGAGRAPFDPKVFEQMFREAGGDKLLVPSGREDA